jgi:hypothetical protein
MGSRGFKDCGRYFSENPVKRKGYPKEYKIKVGLR